MTTEAILPNAHTPEAKELLRWLSEARVHSLDQGEFITELLDLRKQDQSRIAALEAEVKALKAELAIWLTATSSKPQKPGSH